MDAAQHIVKLEPDRGRAGRPHDDRAGAAPTRRSGRRSSAALIGEPAGDPAGRVRRRRHARRCCASCSALVELMGDLGLPGSVVEMADDAAAEGAVGSAQGRPQHHDEPEGRRQAGVSFIEDCAVPLEHLAEYTDAPDRGVRASTARSGTWYAHASVGTLHVRPILDMRRDGAAKMRAIAEEAGALVREYKGAYSRRARRRPVPRRMDRAGSSARAINEAFARDQGPVRSERPAQPRQDRRSAADGRRARCSASRPGYRDASPLEPALDWSAWNVQNDPLTERDHARPAPAAIRRGGFAKAVEMCNNNGHCRKFDAGTMCPSYRVTRDEQHLTRGRANTLRLALSGQLGAGRLHQRRGARGAGPVRRLQGLQARMPDRRRHGADEDRVPAPLASAARLHAARPADRAPAATTRRAPAACRGCSTCATACRRSPRSASGCSASRRSARCRAGAATRSARRRAERDRDAMPRRRAVVLFVDTFNGYFEPENARAALRVLQAAGYRVARRRADARTSRPLCCGRTFLASGHGRRGASARRGALLDALLPFVAARRRRSSASSRRAC